MRTFFFGNKTKTTTSLFFSIHDGVNVRNTLISDQQLHIIYIIEENNNPPPKKKESPPPYVYLSLWLKMRLLQP